MNSMKMKKNQIKFSYPQWALFMMMAFLGLVSSCKKLTEETICMPPTGITIQAVTDTSVQIEWLAAEEGEQYIIKLIQAGQSWTGAKEKRVSGTEKKVIFDDLQQLKDYTIKIQTSCAGANSDFSSELSFKTLSSKAFDITRKWRISRFQSNGIALALQSGDYAEFKAPDIFSQVLLGATSGGTWSLEGPTLDTLKINTGTPRSYRIRAISSTFFRGVGVGNISGDTLELTPL